MSNGTASPCLCAQAQDPQVVSNPPGLPRISYRVDDFTGFRRAMLRPLPAEQAIGAWRPATGDLGLQVLEWCAYLADVLTFYNERIANESYLRTATQPSSIANLVALLGYEPAPGIAATGNVAAMRSAAHPDEPLVIPAGMRMSSVATPGIPAQTFEVAATTSFTSPSSVPVTLPSSAATPQVGGDGKPASVLLAGRVSGVKAEDQLVLADKTFTADDRWALVSVGTLTPETDPRTGAVNTRLTFSAGDWGPSATPLSRPGTDSQAASYRLMRPTATAALWNLTSNGTTLQPVVLGPPFQVHLSAAVRAISPGDIVLFEGGTGSPLALAVVAAVSEEFAAVPYPGSATPLPPPWTDSDIGNPDLAGSASYADGVFTVNGDGNDIWQNFDQFNYVWQALTSDGSITARVTSQSNTSPWAKSGVMIKQSTAIGSPYALLAVTPSNGIAFQYGYSNTVPGGSYSFPQAWLKLARSGATITAYSSADGISWTQVGSTTIPMADPATIGIFTCSHNAAAVCSASIDNVSIAPPGFTVPPDIAVAHTVLTLTTQDSAVLYNVTDKSTVAVRYGFKDVGTIIGTPAAALKSLPATAGVPPSYSPPDLPATAFLQASSGAGVMVTVGSSGPGQVTLTGAGTPPATITTPLAVPLRLLLGVVPVSRGTTVTGEVLGSGNAALARQSFTLSKSPLTYLATGAGSVAALAVYVDGVHWQQVPSFYRQPADARVLVVSRSPDQTITTVTFGDGVNGARLTSGTGNVVATYRYGSGAASPPAGRLTTISQPQPNLASIQNPVAVSGGADPQAAEEVRANAPASVFTFGRAISAIDYEVVASQAPGVARVAAHWTFDGTGQRTLVAVYVGDDEAAVAAASAALAGSGDPNRPVSVLGATAIGLALSCTLVVAADRQVPAVVTAATAAISGPAGLFSPARMGIGQRLYRSAIDAALMVPGVVAVSDLTVQGAPLALDEFLEPGEGSYFDLAPGNITITGVSAGG